MAITPLTYWTEARSPGDVLRRLQHDEKEAVKEALAGVRRGYLRAFEFMIEEISEENLLEQAAILGQIDTLRRQLGLRREPDRERIRELTRERVRRHRQRVKASQSTG